MRPHHHFASAPRLPPDVWLVAAGAAQNVVLQQRRRGCLVAPLQSVSSQAPTDVYLSQAAVRPAPVPPPCLQRPDSKHPQLLVMYDGLGEPQVSFFKGCRRGCLPALMNMFPPPRLPLLRGAQLHRAMRPHHPAFSTQAVSSCQCVIYGGWGYPKSCVATKAPQRLLCCSSSTVSLLPGSHCLPLARV